MKEQSKLKSIRIPVSVIRDIESEAAKSGQDFTKVAVYRMQHFENALTPAMLAKLQDIANKSTEAVCTGSCELAEEVQREVDELWKSLK